MLRNYLYFTIRANKLVFDYVYPSAPLSNTLEALTSHNELAC